jgi:hypothetical protein
MPIRVALSVLDAYYDSDPDSYSYGDGNAVKPMADQDLEIRIRAEADLSAIAQVQKALDDLKARTVSGQSRLLAPVPQELTEASSAFGSGAAGYTGLTSVAAEMERAKAPAAELASAGALLGANLTRARAEAIILVRELATGVPTTRTLSSLLGALGYQIAGASIGFIAIAEGVKSAIGAQQKFNDELAKENEHISNNISKWREELSVASSEADVIKIIAQAVPEIESGTRAAAEAAEHHLTFWQKLLDTVVNIERTTNPLFYQLRNAFVTFDDLAKQTEKGFSDAASRQAEAGADVIRSAREIEAAYNQFKENPVQAVEQLTNSIKSLQDQQNSLDLTTKDGLSANIKLWYQYQQQIDNNKKVISDLDKITENANKNLDKALRSASAQTKEVLANEQAAQQARAQGRDREADQYEKSAEQFKRGMTSGQAAELSNIQNLQKALLPPEDTRTQIQKDIDANRKSFEDFWSQPEVQQVTAPQPLRNIPPGEEMYPTPVSGQAAQSTLDGIKGVLERILSLWQ